MTDAGVGFFKKGDTVSFTNGPTLISSGSYVLSNVSSDGKTLTLATATAGANITLATTVWLTTTETPGLIAGSTTASANSVVNAGTTNLPY